MSSMDKEALKIAWQKEEDAGQMTGWDFSYINGRFVEEQLPWDYEKKVRDFLRPGVRLLDMDTGGGEFLLSLDHPYELTSVTEGWQPNFELCKKRLSPLGIRVEYCTCEEGVRMPFEDESFDLVINRHGSYDPEEVHRILRPGGFFVTQQVGGQNDSNLSSRLLPGFVRPGGDFNLENEGPRFEKAGFRLMYQNQAYLTSKFLDVGAICWFAKVLPWEFPNFSVEKCFPQLLKLQEQLENEGFVPLLEHRFIIVAKRK